jgi:signal transduction histidine kinase
LQSASEHLVRAAQELSMARDLDAIVAIVRRVARELTGAQGATVVLREGDQCYYVDEDAISPLWKGQRFPITQCISGWVMVNKDVAVIDDVFVDSRIPHEVYRATFVKSLAMVPIRSEAPLGAIGNYWSQPHQTSDDELRLLRALADLTAVAMANVQLYGELQRRIGEAQDAVRIRDEFLTVASHELRTPLTTLLLQLQRLEDLSARESQTRATRLPESASRALISAQRLAALVDGLLDASRLAHGHLRLNLETFDLVQTARDVLERFAVAAKRAACTIEFETAPLLLGRWDRLRIEQVLTSLLSNAVKFGMGRPITVLLEEGATGAHIEVRDQGIGIAPEVVDRIFARFGRAGPISQHGGLGLGLYLAREVIEAHGGTIHFASAPNKGCTFTIELPLSPPAEPPNLREA